MRTITEAILHCTATRANWREDQTGLERVAEIKRWHVEDNKWSDIGYHYLIDRDGVVYEGRPIERAGAHTKGNNSNTIGIALFGGHGSSENDLFSDNFTDAQEAALRDLLDKLKAEHGFNKVSGHNQYAAKACPGFDVPRWLAKKPPRKTPAESKTIQAGGAVAAVSAGGGILAGLSKLDPIAQYIIIGGSFAVLLLALFIIRERLKHWAAGVR